MVRVLVLRCFKKRGIDTILVPPHFVLHDNSTRDSWEKVAPALLSMPASQRSHRNVRHGGARATNVYQPRKAVAYRYGRKCKDCFVLVLVPQPLLFCRTVRTMVQSEEERGTAVLRAVLSGRGEGYRDRSNTCCPTT